MKLQSKQLFVLTMTLLLFSILPTWTNAQTALTEANQIKPPKKCHNGHCPNGYSCVNGYCVEDIFCNCFVRPIPFECAALCGFRTDPTHADIILSEPNINSAEVNLELSTTTDALSFASKRCKSDADCGRYRRCFDGQCLTWGGSWQITGDLGSGDHIDNASIEYWLPSDGIVSINLYDGTGQLIRTLVDEWKPSGDHLLVWNEKDDVGNMLNPGVYQLTLQASDIRETTKVIAFN